MIDLSKYNYPWPCLKDFEHFYRCKNGFYKTIHFAAGLFLNSVSHLFLSPSLVLNFLAGSAHSRWFKVRSSLDDLLQSKHYFELV